MNTMQVNVKNLRRAIRAGKYFDSKKQICLICENKIVSLVCVNELGNFKYILNEDKLTTTNEKCTIDGQLIVQYIKSFKGTFIDIGSTDVNVSISFDDKKLELPYIDIEAPIFESFEKKDILYNGSDKLDLVNVKLNHINSITEKTGNERILIAKNYALGYTPNQISQVPNIFSSESIVTMFNVNTITRNTLAAWTLLETPYSLFKKNKKVCIRSKNMAVDFKIQKGITEKSFNKLNASINIATDEDKTFYIQTKELYESLNRLKVLSTGIMMNSTLVLCKGVLYIYNNIESKETIEKINTAENNGKILIATFNTKLLANTIKSIYKCDENIKISIIDKSLVLEADNFKSRLGCLDTETVNQKLLDSFDDDEKEEIMNIIQDAKNE